MTFRLPTATPTPPAIIHFTEECGGQCPVQATGTVDGYPFYFRARGVSRVAIVEAGLDPVSAVLGQQVDGYSVVLDVYAGIGYPGWWDPEDCQKQLIVVLEEWAENKERWIDAAKGRKD